MMQANTTLPSLSFAAPNLARSSIAAMAKPAIQSDDLLWQAVMSRDLLADGKFFYAVQTTGIFCRPCCPSRRPARSNVHFFFTSAEALAAGYRACRRCRPESVPPQTARVLAACDYLQRRHEKTPTLSELGCAVGMSPYALQRLFRQVLGVTPRQYYATRQTNRFREGLAATSTVTAAIYRAGYGSARGAYERSTGTLGMRPAEYRKGGAGVEIRYTTCESPIGRMMVAATERGLCAVAFGDSEEQLVAGLHSDFFSARVERDDTALAGHIASVLALLQEHPTAVGLPLDVRATAFQWRVWQALQQIPPGETRSYAAIAQSLGRPAAVRAVARACGQNPVAVVIPCHRVIGKGGQLTGYRWGVERKRQLLERESAVRRKSLLLGSEGK